MGGGKAYHSFIICKGILASDRAGRIVGRFSPNLLSFVKMEKGVIPLALIVTFHASRHYHLMFLKNFKYIFCRDLRYTFRV
jgi:hypothetical protein